MAQKKDRSRFSIKFRENDPAHERTICILESQGQRNIAPFLVNAVLHFVQCSETPDITRMLAEKAQVLMDKNAVEDIVKEILLQEGIIKAGIQKTKEVQVTAEKKLMEDIKSRKEEIPAESIKSQNPVNDDVREMISRTLSAFRSE